MRYLYIYIYTHHIYICFATLESFNVFIYVFYSIPISAVKGSLIKTVHLPSASSKLKSATLPNSEHSKISGIIFAAIPPFPGKSAEVAGTFFNQ